MLVARLRAAGCVFAEDEARLLIEQAADAGELERLTVRRVAGEPLEYVLGWAEFAGLRLRVAPGVFVPRRRTELLLRLALEAMETTEALETTEAAQRAVAPRAPSGRPRSRGEANREQARLLELCCGVAPVATAVKTRMPAAEVLASELDPDAVAVARANLEPLGGGVLPGDLFAALPEGRGRGFDVIVANAPYVPSGELRNMPREAREHEHPLALDGGADGLALHRRIAAEAVGRLRPGGIVLVETSRRQASVDRAIFAERDWRVEIVTDDGLDATAVRASGR